MPQPNRNRRAWWYVILAAIVLIVILIIARGWRNDMRQDAWPMTDSVEVPMPPAGTYEDGMDTGAYDLGDTGRMDTGMTNPAPSPGGNINPGMGGAGAVPVTPPTGSP